MINCYTQTRASGYLVCTVLQCTSNKQYDESRKHGILLNGYFFFTTQLHPPWLGCSCIHSTLCQATTTEEF